MKLLLQTLSPKFVLLHLFPPQNAVIDLKHPSALQHEGRQYLPIVGKGGARAAVLPGSQVSAFSLHSLFLFSVIIKDLKTSVEMFFAGFSGVFGSKGSGHPSGRCSGSRHA